MGLFRMRRHDRNARCRPVANLHRHLRNRQLHESSGSREQDPVRRLDADEAARGASRASDFLARRARLEADRRRPTTARLRAANCEAQCRDAGGVFRRRIVRSRAYGGARRLCRPLSPRDHGALLTQLPGSRAVGDLRTVRRSARAHRRQRDRSRHHHQLRKQARVGNIPPRAAALGDIEPPFNSS